MADVVKWLPLKELSSSLDLCETAFEEACEKLGIDYSSATIIASIFDSKTATEIAIKYQTRLLLLPSGVLLGEDQWMVVSDVGAVWSPGA